MNSSTKFNDFIVMFWYNILTFKLKKMNKQSLYRKKYKKLFPQWKESMEIYYDLIDKEVSPNKTVLAVGCGYNPFLKKIFDRAKNTYGVDPDQQALSQNTFIKNKFIGTAENIPLENDSVDIITSEWVFEHISDADKAVREFYRVLRPGGKIIFLTPNAWNYNAFFIRLIPNKLHPFFTKLLYNRLTEDTYPTTYALNSPLKIEKGFTKYGFKKEKLIFNGDPSYISFGPISFRIAVFIENFINRFLPKTKVHIIGIYIK